MTCINNISVAITGKGCECVMWMVSLKHQLSVSYFYEVISMRLSLAKRGECATRPVFRIQSLLFGADLRVRENSVCRKKKL